MSSFLIVPSSNCPGGGFGGPGGGFGAPGGGFGGPGGGFRTGKSSGKPLLLPVLKKPPPGPPKPPPGPPKPPPGPPKRKIIGGSLRKSYINCLYKVF